MKKTIVITGASRGIGKAIAIELAGKDTNIVINCVNNVDKLNEVKSIIEEKGSVCETFIGDMGNYSDVQKMFDMCLQRFGQVDVLIMMKRHCGKIINISSVWGLYGASCEVAYSATKGAVNSFTKALAKELAPSGIQVNAVACGAIDTEMNGHLSDDDKASLAEEIPAGRFGNPQEVAELVKSLAGMNSYLTGQIITLDGGWI